MAKQARVWKIDHKKLEKHGPKGLVTFLAKEVTTTWPDVRNKGLLDNRGFNQLRDKGVFIIVSGGAKATGITKKVKPEVKPKVKPKVKPIKKIKITSLPKNLKKKKDTSMPIGIGIDVGMAHDLQEVDDGGKEVVQSKEKRSKKKPKAKVVEEPFF